MKVIYKTVVGSRMHGLHTPESDYDERYITLASLKEFISPFQKRVLKSAENANGDVEFWELSHFVHMLCKGNPTCFEVIKSPLFDKKFPLAEEIRSIFPTVIDNKSCLLAHTGFAESQLKRYLIPFSETVLQEDKTDVPLINTLEENKLRRTLKATVAAHRVIAQAQQILLTGDFKPVVKEYSEDLHNKLMSIKTLSIDQLDYSFLLNHRIDITTQIQELNNLYFSLSEKEQNRKVDIDFVENFLLRIYKLEA